MVVRKILFRVLIIIVPLSLGIFFSIYINQGHGSLEDVSATVLRDAKPLPKFVLEDHRGHAFTNETLKGQWSFVFFGYTHCPDVCPITLALLNQVDQVLKKDSGDKIPKTIWDSEKGQALEQQLMTCQNKCYDCHACEDTFGVDHIDSLVGINNPRDHIGEEQFQEIKEWDERTYLEKRAEEDAARKQRNLEEGMGPFKENIQQTVQWPN